MASTALAEGEKRSLVDLKKLYEAYEAVLEWSLKASEDKPSEAEDRLHDFDLSSNTAQHLEIKVYQLEETIKKADEYVQFLEENVVDHCAQFLRETSKRKGFKSRYVVSRNWQLIYRPFWNGTRRKMRLTKFF